MAAGKTYANTGFTKGSLKAGNCLPGTSSRLRAKTRKEHAAPLEQGEATVTETKSRHLLPQKLFNLIDFQENDRFAFLVLKFQHWCYKNRSGLRSRPNLVLLMSLAGNPSIGLFLHYPLHVCVLFASWAVSRTWCSKYRS